MQSLAFRPAQGQRRCWAKLANHRRRNQATPEHVLAVETTAVHTQDPTCANYTHIERQGIDACLQDCLLALRPSAEPTAKRLFFDINDSVGLGELMAQAIVLSSEFGNALVMGQHRIYLGAGSLSLECQTRCTAALGTPGRQQLGVWAIEEKSVKNIRFYGHLTPFPP